MGALGQIGSTMTNPWIMGGDFNNLLAIEDRISGDQVLMNEIEDFNNFIDTYPIQEVKHVEPS